MEFTKHKTKMQHHTTTIVLSTHKANITSPATSPELELSPIHSPPSSSPKEKVRNREKHKERRKDKDRKKKDKEEESKKVVKRLYKLPKAVLKLVCNHLSFEDMFVCAAVSKKMSCRFYRFLTSYKKCSSIEKADIKVLVDPSALLGGVTFYRVTPTTTLSTSPSSSMLNMSSSPSSSSISSSSSTSSTSSSSSSSSPGGGYSMMGMSAIKDVACKRECLTVPSRRQMMMMTTTTTTTTTTITNAVSHSQSGQVAYHLKQLEHMLIRFIVVMNVKLIEVSYKTVNGNEVVRVTNNWIFFNRKLFIKINNTAAQDTNTAEVKPDDRLCLVDVVVEANLRRKAKSSFFGRPANAETFCQINLDHLHLRTSVASHEADPVWNEDSSFVVRKDTKYKLQIAMLEYGKLGRHTQLGMVEISLKDLASNVVHDIWQPVQATDVNFSGDFHVMIHKSPVPKKEVDSRTLGILGHYGPICDTVPIRVEWGDVILISNSEFYTHIAKLGTLSVWDHVAMVVERGGELHLFESTPDGVFTSPLDRRLRFYLQSSTLGVRRLTLDRTPAMKKSLKSFVKEVDGRPYKQNWMDLVRAWQGSHTSEDLSSIFCSELVAAAYKRMGLLDNKISSNNFLPVDFALPNNSKVKLLQGRLEKIRMIYAYDYED